MKRYATFYGVRCYYDEVNNNLLEGRGPFSEWLLNWFALPFSQLIEFTCSLIDPFHESAFPIKVGELVEKDDFYKKKDNNK